MSERIKGFTIELSLDSINVDSGLKDLKSSMRQMNSEMRKNMSSFDRGEKSVEKYGVQLSGLNKKLELQKTTTESARKHYEKMAETHGESSTQAQKAATAYNNEVAQLNNLERHIGKVTDEMNAFKRQQDIQSTALFKTGDALEGFGDGLSQVSSKARDIGGSLTKWITLPAMGVATAVGGIVASFGWGRLVGLDTAQAQLKGLGYDTEEVGRISDQVTNAIEGGMTTMAEGTAIAAGGMAAGVKEGAELEKYIKLVGDAAVGANRPVDEMAQIFNRVQGSGKLMTQELNMIEQGMPGFAQAMADNLDVSQEEFRKMVTAGEVSSKDFMKVMDTFAGGMAEAYADSWQGMVANTKAYIGIIGESLLGGVFEKSKESIAEFIELLSSDEVVTWAEEMGNKIGETFSSIVDSVKSGVEWFKNLSSSQQDMITKFGLFVIALGPILLGLGTLGGIIGKVSSGLGVFFKFLAPIMVPLKAIGGAAGSTGASVGLLSKAFTLLTGPVGIAIGIIALLTAGFTTAYKRSETFRNFISDLGEKIKEVFFGIVDWIRPGFDAVLSFFGEIKASISGFINSEGPSLIEAFQNIWNFVGPILGWIADKVKWAFNTIIKPIISLAMKAVEIVIKMVWQNIKGVITGVLDVIMGAIKIFSGLFTGNWSKMWEGTKQLASGAISAVWNYINLLFIGRILKGIGVFVKSFGGFISKMWSGAKTTFLNGITAVWNWMKNSFVGKIIASIVKFVSNFKMYISTMWAFVKHRFSTVIAQVFNSIKNSFVGRIISSIIGFVKNFKSNISSMWSSIRTMFTNRINNIRNSISNSFVGRMLDSVRNLKTNFVRIAGDMWQGVKKQFTNIVDGAKGLPKRIGDGIRNAKDKAIGGMKSVGRGIMSAAGKPINATIDGVNWILRKVKAPEITGKWKIPTYAKGTNLGGHPEDGPAIVGDKHGRELINLPTGESFLSPDTDTMLNLPKGSQVIPNFATEKILSGEIPQYAKGTKGWKSKLKDIWSFIKKPFAAVKTMMDGIKIRKSEKGMARKVATGGLNYLKDKPKEYIKGIFKGKEESEDNPNYSPAGPSSPGAAAWRPQIKLASARMNANASAAEINGIIAQINRESGGNQRIVQSNAVWDVNTAAGNPARGLLQYIPQTFNAYKTRGHGNIYSGYDQLRAFFNNSTWRRDLPYGRRGWGPRGAKRGYETGGLIQSEHMAMLGEDGPEMVIPLNRNRRTDAMKLLALTGRMLGADSGNSKRPNSLPNVKGGNESNALLDAVLKQNEILMQLLQKDNTAVIGFEEVYQPIKKRLSKDKYSSNKQRRR